MDDSSTAAIDGSREESHADRLLMGDTLESANEVSPLEILSWPSTMLCSSRTRGNCLPLTRESIDHEVHPACQCRRRDSRSHPSDQICQQLF